jgi:hypothetical protein
MIDSTMRPDVGQESTGLPVDSEEDILDFLARFTAYLDENLPRVRAACARLDARIRSQREELHEEEAPDTEPEPVHAPGLAFLSDGRAALHVSHLGGASMHDRETWTGVVLSVAETSDALEKLADAADDAAGNIAGYILFGSKKKDDDDDRSS